jgi:glycosyltransferase involved in cell wall biosynthesis
VAERLGRTEVKVTFWHFYTFRLLRGIETLIVSLSNALVRRGIDVSLVTSTPALQPLVEPDPRIQIHAYPTSRYYAHRSIVPFYVSHFLRYESDHVVAFFADFGESATWRIVKNLRALPLSIYLCYPYSAVPHRYQSFMQAGWHKSAKHIFADARWIAAEAERQFEREVPVVPVGTDPERFRPDAEMRLRMRQRLGFSESDIVLLSVSALEARKGPRRALQAVGRLRGRFPNLRYLVLGTGEDEATLREMAGTAGLEDHVFFGGVTRELEAYYNAADIFIMLPESEGNSIACHEAMSCALPVLVSNTGGFPETVPLDAGCLVDPDDQRSIDASLEQLIARASLRNDMGRAGRGHVLQNYTWDHCASRFLEVLQ